MFYYALCLLAGDSFMSFGITGQPGLANLANCHLHYLLVPHSCSPEHIARCGGGQLQAAVEKM